jgi:hypothetical protein
MTVFRVTYHDGRTEDIEGEDVVVESSAHIVIRTTALVMGRPRLIVARRLPGAQVRDVTEL